MPTTLINRRKRIWKSIGWTLFILFILMNAVAFFHAYKFTHFSDPEVQRTKDAKDLSSSAKIKALLLGINNPRPTNFTKPSQPFETINLQSNKSIECWSIKQDSSKGTVIIFHGYGGKKSSMLDKSDEFLELGYNTFLVDFMGSGGSEGNQTTIGYHEAEEVKTAFEYVNSTGENNTYLFGTSLGAAAILKAVHDYKLTPDGIILECPFGSLYKTTCARFHSMHAPVFPMAGLLVFWGGVQNRFWAFGHKPSEYAKGVQCPALLLYGEKDEKVSRQETDEIYTNMKGAKQLKTYPLAAHENYLIKYKKEWKADITEF